MTPKPGLGLAARGVALVLPIACGAFAIANPQSVLYGGTAWLIVLLCSFAGFGHVIERVVGLEVDLGLRLAWGIAGYLALAGVGYALGVLSAPVLLVLL